MTQNDSVPEPSRATEIARLELTRLPAASPLAEVFRRTCETCANAIGVERVGVWLFIDHGSALRCVNVYERSTGEHSSGALLRVVDFPSYFSSLTLRKALPAEVARTDPATAELADRYLEPLDISSMLDAGIFIDGELEGVVCHEQVGKPCEWTTEARDFAGSIADFLALRIKSAETRDLRNAFLTQQERMIALERTAVLEQLAAGVAHDFRNLLTVFLAHGDMLHQRRDLPEDARELAAVIVDAAERGIALASELMEFASRPSRKPSVHDLAVAIREFLPVLCAAIGGRHEVRYVPIGDSGRVMIDRSDFTRLLLNLAINARDAMPLGGPIEIRLSIARLEEEEASGAFVLLEVEDHGPGIDETTKKHIFEPFFTTKSSGTGLGLAIVRRIAERAGGFVRVSSELGRGAKFQAYFPRIGSNNGVSPNLQPS